MQHNDDYVLTAVGAVFSYHQPHILHPPAVLFAGRYDINSSGVDAAVAEDIGELGNILLDAVKRAGKQVTKVMRKDLARVDVRVPAKLFHFAPDVRAADGLARFGNENCTVVVMVTLCVFQQLFCRLLTMMTVLVLPLQLTFA